MSDLYDMMESALMWGAVLTAIGLVIYLAYLQCLKVKHCRSRRRHRAHRAMKRQTSHQEPPQAKPDSSGAVQQPGKS